MKRGPYVLQPDGTYRDPAKPDEWKLSVEMIKLLHDAGWIAPHDNAAMVRSMGEYAKGNAMLSAILKDMH